MIEFIQDYVTKALPPETFEDAQRVDRSPESELYFVHLGVAGFVDGDKLLDQDYQPIVRKTVVVVATADRRFADTGRGGEVIGLDGPQRASTGPGNEVLFSGQPDSVNLSGVQIEQLRGDLAASVQQFDEHRDATTSQIDELTNDLTAAQGARETALADLAIVTADLEKTAGELTDVRRQLEEANETAFDRQRQLDAAAEQVKVLEADLAKAKSKPARG